MRVLGFEIGLFCTEFLVLKLVSGLSWGTDDQSLRDAFAHFGEVVDGKLLFNHSAGLVDLCGTVGSLEMN